MPANLPELQPHEKNKVDVQSTTFAIDAVARFVCNTFEEALSNPQFDAIVIGSGMYGAYCAEKIYRLSAIAGKPLRVLVLEAGPFLISEHIQNLSRIGFGIQDLVADQPWKSNVGFSSHSYCVGGKSVFWGGWSPRLTREDLDLWPAEIRQYLHENYNLLEEETGVDPGTEFIQGELYEAIKDAVDAALPMVKNLDEWQEPPIAVQGQSPASGLFSFDKFSSLPLLIDAIREDADNSKGNDGARRLLLVPKARAFKLETNKGFVNKIQLLVNGEKKSLDVNPNCSVVLALGSVESTRLALASFPTTANSAEEILGRNCMVHTRSNTTMRIKRSALAPALSNKLQTAALHVRGSIDEGRFHLQLTVAANRDGNSDALYFRMIPDLDLLGAILAQEDAEWIAITIRGIGEMQGFKDKPIRSADTSWVDLSPFDKDQFGNPRAFIYLKETDVDLKLWDAMDKATLDLGLKLADGNPDNIEYLYTKNGVEAWYSDPPPAATFKPEGVRDGLGSTFHESGTLWMGEPAKSVTDVNGQFHHVGNAFCTDQALFPTVGSANPVLTGLVLSRKVASQIVDRNLVEGQVFPTEPGFTPLFTGDFSNWKTTGGGGFQVLFGTILESFTFARIGVLYTVQEYSDFILKLDWQMFDNDANSGVFLRFPSLEDNPSDAEINAAYKQCYEVQIDETGFNFPESQKGNPLPYGSAFHKTGAIYELAPARKWASKRLGLWNTYEIEAKGNSISVKLNGELVSEYSGPEARSLKGHIGLQYHTGRVQFRNIRIKEL